MDITNYIILALLILYIIYIIRKHSLIKSKNFVYSTECVNCLAWNHRDVRPKCEKMCSENLDKNYKYNLSWKRSRDLKKIICGCSK